MILNILIFITSIAILSYLFSHRRIFIILSFALMTVLSLFQIKQTQITDFFNLTEMETVHQINRMHQYPSYAFRLGHILEERPESIIFFKLNQNFTDTFNLTLFPNHFLTIIFLPFFIIGIFKSISKHLIFTLSLIISSVLLFTFIGHQNLYGPVLLYPLIFTYSLYSLIPLKNEK